MRICDAQNALETMLELAAKDKESALSVYATARYLIAWLGKVAKSENIGNFSGIKEKLRDVHNGFLFCCGLLPEEGMNSGPLHYARQGLSVLSWGTLFGSVAGLMEKNIIDEDATFP